MQSLERDVQRMIETQKDHEMKLTSGRIEFAEIRRDITSLTEAVKGLTTTVQAAGGVVMLAVLGAVLKLVVVGA